MFISDVRVKYLLFAVILVYIVLLQGNIPFFSLSTLGQAIVISGYPYDLLTADHFSIYSHSVAGRDHTLLMKFEQPDRL